jgi:hypothetical protein
MVKLWTNFKYLGGYYHDYEYYGQHMDRIW